MESEPVFVEVDRLSGIKTGEGEYENGGARDGLQSSISRPRKYVDEQYWQKGEEAYQENYYRIAEQR